MGGSLQDANSNPINLGPYINPRPTQAPYGMGGPMVPTGPLLGTPGPIGANPVIGGPIGGYNPGPIQVPYGMGGPMVPTGNTPPPAEFGTPIGGGNMPPPGFRMNPPALGLKPTPLPGRPIIDPAAPGSQGSVYGQQPTRGPAPRDVMPYTLQQGLGGLGRKV